MPKASVVDSEDVSVWLRGQVAESISAPALSYMTCVTVDLIPISVATRSVGSSENTFDVQLIKTLANEELRITWKALVRSKI